MTDYEFQGWLGEDEKSVQGHMKWGKFEPKKWEEDDVDIEISHCGICGSDLHQLSSGWGPTPYPCVVGHEIIGRAVKVGKNVKHVKVGDRVGVGAQARSCMQSSCAECSSGHESHCGVALVNTYGSVYPNGEGKSYGGYADYNRTNGHFVLPIPKALSSAEAAPMLCGGITVFSPLKQNGCGPGKTVGIVGVGGLGHFGVLFAKALGADRVVGISRKGDKRDDVLKLGADEYIATGEDKGWEKKHKRTLDLIVCTVSSEKMPLTHYLGLLKVKGTFIQVGAPDGGNLPPINAFTLIGNGIKVGGSAIGSPAEIAEMLQLAADKKVHPWIQERSLKDANQAIVDLADGKARYRYVLVNEKNAQRHANL
ncbi:GroES-like protein [Pseudovirgaria hyperparasitica]|uniref:alcohol dehydrogenase (NADP(+)) n=1 Tax=Pseudovirgaria hyperparasitica TaxID=470096 RepID=A0A6A6W7X7_9PEZI|nr:GroES-like protein [Pseudovirgaria hyperparasitica]KAF2758962.1 GroES-like protein [Pseudovirgaria hyperparasitica]